MTSEEIKGSDVVEFSGGAGISFQEDCIYSLNTWLKEIAYQFAKQNELQAEYLKCAKRSLEIQEAVYADKVLSHNVSAEHGPEYK